MHVFLQFDSQKCTKLHRFASRFKNFPGEHALVPPLCGLAPAVLRVSRLWRFADSLALSSLFFFFFCCTHVSYLRFHFVFFHEVNCFSFLTKFSIFLNLKFWLTYKCFSSIKILPNLNTNGLGKLYLAWFFSSTNKIKYS